MAIMRLNYGLRHRQAEAGAASVLLRIGAPIKALEQPRQVFRGNPGPELAPVLFARLLGEEARLLNAEPRSWHAQFWIDQGRPFDDPTGSDLASRFGVDPKLTRWTPSAEQPSNPFEGSWVEPS